MTDGKQICCAGEVMIEMVPVAGMKEYHQDFAGDTYNSAVYLAREGHRVQYLTRLGDDAFSMALVGLMRAEGIDTSSIETAPGQRPGLYVISNDDTGERQFSYWRDSSPARCLFDEVPTLAAPDLFFFSGITLAVTRGGVRNLVSTLEDLRSKGAKVAFDPNYRPALWDDAASARELYRTVLPLCNLVLATQEDEALLWGIDDPVVSRDLYLGYGASEVVIKGSKLVAHAWHGEAHCKSQAAAVEAVDTTGAGDAFNAGYLSARLRGEDLATSIARAQALAALVVQHRGAVIPRSPTDN